MEYKEYTFKEGFTIRSRMTPSDVIYAMGETHVREAFVYEVYVGDKFIESFETYEEAKKFGMELKQEE